MKIFAYKSFHRFYKDLPLTIQKKVDKQISLLAENFRHPSIQTKKIQGDSIYLRVVGNHDEVLKNP